MVNFNKIFSFVIACMLISACKTLNRPFSSSFSRLLEDKNFFERYDSIESVVFNLKIQRSPEGLYYWIYVSRSDTAIGHLQVDKVGVIKSIRSKAFGETDLYFYYPRGTIKYLNFSSHIVYRMAERRKIGEILLEGYVFRFDEKARIAAIYFCERSMVIKEVFCKDKKYSMLGKKLQPGLRKLKWFEKRVLKRVLKK